MLTCDQAPFLGGQKMKKDCLIREFSQAIFVNGLFRKLQVSTPVVLCFIECSFRPKLEQKLENTLRALKLFSFTDPAL